MNCPAAVTQASETADSACSEHAGTGIRLAAGVTVAALAGIAAAISYSHMRELAAAHGETGWQAHTFPLSVDGIEIVASLVLLADRRTGRSSGWLPWAALVAGTTASLAANIAAAGADLVGRVVAGWPAFALLVAVKLMSQLLEPRRGVDRPATVVDDGSVPGHRRLPAAEAGGDDLRTTAGPLPGPQPIATNGHHAASTLPSMQVRPRTTNGTGRASHPRAGTGRAAALGTGSGDGSGTIKPSPPMAGTAAHVGTGTAPDIASLLPAARVVWDRLLDRGEVLTRDTLAAQLRQDGHPVRNAKVSRLLTALRQEV